MFMRNLLAGASLLGIAATTQCGLDHNTAHTHLDLSSTPTVGNFGDSPLGTLAQTPLPKFLTNNPLPNGLPWGNINQNDDPKTPPNTGVTRFYDFTITRGSGSPDGVPTEMILINGQFPGPMIEANWGDYIEVTVHNNITGPEEGTSLHWHGMLQKDTPWMDGVPSISQCPIAPGSTFVYRFKADVFGTGWYHSHYSAQYLEGVAGPMVIYGPTYAQFDKDLGPIMLADWFHTPYFPLMQDIMSSNTSIQSPSTNNILIDGRMPFNCSLGVPKSSTCSAGSPYSKFRVQTGKTYKLRLVNSGAGSLLYFSIDNHQLTVISNDFVDVQPYNVTQVVLGTGQRSDVLFTPQGNGTIWMRTITFGKFCGATRALQTRAKAIIFLNDAPETALPSTIAWPDPIDNGLCSNEPLNKTIPFYPIALPEPSVTYNITINQFVNATGQKLFYMNGNSFQGDYNDPVLLLAEQKNYTYPYDPKWNVVNFGTNTSIRIVVYNNNTSPHPMHLHGHDFYVLHDGAGPWDGVSIVRPENPQRRDTHNLAPFGHLVIQFDADNPGTWPFHCHIAFHLSQGLFMTFMERPAEINELQIPQVMAQTCTDWEKYTSKNVVEQIDSGLRRRERIVRKRV